MQELKKTGLIFVLLLGFFFKIYSLLDLFCLEPWKQA